MLEAFGVSDPGCVRTNNEDYYLLAPAIGLYVVADGMGGANAGEHASKLAAETVWEVLYNSPERDHETLLRAFAALSSDETSGGLKLLVVGRPGLLSYLVRLAAVSPVSRNRTGPGADLPSVDCWCAARCGNDGPGCGQGRPGQ